ncbi:IS5-like element IS470 family transposase [Myceligenerans halotolerans]
MPAARVSGLCDDGVVTYEAVLPLRAATVRFVAGLLERLQAELGTRAGRRALDAWRQAVLVCRWFADGTRVKQLARDNRIGLSTCYRYLDEGMNALAAAMPRLESVLLAAKIAGHSHVMIDGTLIPTDRCKASGPTKGVDLWWSGKHHKHGGNVQVVTAPDGWPIWCSPVRPGREHDTTAARRHPGLLDHLDAWTRDAHGVRDGRRHALADLGYQGEDKILTVPHKTPKKGKLTDDQKACNTLHSAVRALAERGNALLKGAFKVLDKVSMSPGKITQITAAALVILHIEHDRTT